MIVSVSRRTDILAFHPGWFRERLEAGFAEVPNPFRPSRKRIVPLKRGDVDAFVFWTRDPRPSMGVLEDLEKEGLPFCLMVSLTNYPEALETNVPRFEEAAGIFEELSGRFGAGRVAWRYDPVLLSNMTPPEWHAGNFEELCRSISPFTKRVITSLFDPYGPAMRRLKTVEGLVPMEPAGGEPVATLAGMRASAERHGLEIQSCCEGEAFERAGIRRGACVDAGLLNGLFGLELEHRKDKGQRKECLCSKSVDIGSYDTCRGGCLYCYANR